MPLHPRSRSIGLLFWILTLITLPIWAVADHAGWDVVFYRNAVVAMRAGHDPYVDAMAAQEAFHRDLALHPNATPPYSYVYSPLTLPPLRLVGRLPGRLTYIAYAILSAISAFALVWVGFRTGEAADRPFLNLVTPVAVFFPGLLAHDTVLSGNVAFLLYALVLLGAAYGWMRGKYLWCYVAIIVASCFKAPLLSLVVVPLFSARKQWLPSTLTTAIGVLLFAMQPLVWPSLFHHFLQAVELQFSYNHDFGSSPAGILSNVLAAYGISYSPLSEIFYLVYACLVFATLLYLSRQFFRGKFSITHWAPVLLVGALLLNPRLMEYDVAPLALPMALIGWRFAKRFVSIRTAAIIYFCFFVSANLLATNLNGVWKPTECFLLVSFFAAGCWNLFQECRPTSVSAKSLEISSRNMLPLPTCSSEDRWPSERLCAASSRYKSLTHAPAQPEYRHP